MGPAFVEAALAAGHSVTLFNRGLTNPDLFPHLEKLRGLRSTDADDQDLSALARRHWDAAIDVWPPDPSLATSAATLVKDRTKQYLYVSSVGVYDQRNSHGLILPKRLQWHPGIATPLAPEQGAHLALPPAILPLVYAPATAARHS